MTFEQNKLTSFCSYAKNDSENVALAGHNHEFLTKNNKKILE